MSKLRGRIKQMESGFKKLTEREQCSRLESDELRRQIEAGHARAGNPPWWRPSPWSIGTTSTPPKKIDFREEILKGRFHAEALREAWEDAGRPKDWSSRGPWPETTQRTDR